MRASALNMALAEKLLQAFSASTGVSCFLLEKSAEQERPVGPFPCAFCKMLQEFNISARPCLSMHRHSAAQSERFGGRYIYFCPHGLAHFVSPVLNTGRTAAYLVGGPVLILNPEDFLAGLSLPDPLDTAAEAQLSQVLQAFPKRESAVLNQLSFLLFSLAAQLGASSREMLLAMDTASIQQAVGGAVLDLNQQKADVFPAEKEQALSQAIFDGDLAAARRAFNELSGYIFFHSGGDMKGIRGLAAELLFTISLAARSRGAARSEVLSFNQKYYGLLNQSPCFEDVISRLSEALRFYVNLSDLRSPAAGQDTVDKALRYIRQHYCEKLSLEDAAAHVSLSPVYFSRLFKQSTGQSFNLFLNQLRVRKSAALLLKTGSSILEIAIQCGFEDQSYFSKVFKKFLNVSPARFRQQPVDIDKALEKGGRAEAGRSAF